MLRRSKMTAEQIDRLIERSSRVLKSIAPSLPFPADLRQELQDGQNAEQRGYFLPDEDERVRTVFARYLTARAVLRATLQELRDLRRGGTVMRPEQEIRAFAVGYCAACMLMRAGRFLVDAFSDAKTVWVKLDEAEPRYGIPARQFTRIYRSVTRPGNLLGFYRAVLFAHERRAELDALADDPRFAPTLELLRNEEEHLETSASRVTGRILNYRMHSVRRRYRANFNKVMFTIFKLSGSAIAEMRNPFKVKRVTPRVRRRIATLLQPGDVIITRHDDAMSNLFLPGFWPHSALYIGELRDRQQLGVNMSDDKWSRSQDPVCVLEAKKDGVQFRSLEETLAVDCCTILRPRLNSKSLSKALTRAVTHEGKLYDFEFDFTRSDCMVCTEVIYRTYHGLEAIEFSLSERAGRYCLTAEDLLDHALDQHHFDVVAVYGVRGSRLVTGEKARDALSASYRSVASGHDA